jgi:hypothetical protein
MDKGFWIGLGIAIASPALQYAVKQIPAAAAWAGVALGAAVALWPLVPVAYRPAGPAYILYSIGAISIIAAIAGQLSGDFRSSNPETVQSSAANPQLAQTHAQAAALAVGQRANSARPAHKRQIAPNFAMKPVYTGDRIEQSNNNGTTIGKVETLNMGPSPQEIDFQRRRGLIHDIVHDWMLSNDGVPSTSAAILDKASGYINQQLRLRGEKWTFDRASRKALGFPPAAGDSYEDN